jgi:hypothetical protein
MNLAVALHHVRQLLIIDEAHRRAVVGAETVHIEKLSVRSAKRADWQPTKGGQIYRFASHARSLHEDASAFRLHQHLVAHPRERQRARRLAKCGDEVVAARVDEGSDRRAHDDTCALQG